MNGPLERLETQLRVAEERLAKITVERDAIVKRAEGRHWTETDSAIGSGIRRKPNRKADAARFAKYDREAKVFAQFDEAEQMVAARRRRLEDAMSEAKRARFTADDLRGAAVVRSHALGWRRVRRVNQKTVSVESGYSWVDVMPIDDVIDFRATAP